MDRSCGLVRYQVCDPRIPIEGVVPDGARFGSSLTWGDFDGDGSNDLAVGAPNAAVSRQNIIPGSLDDYTVNDAGMVMVLWGLPNTPFVNDISQVFSILYQPIPPDPLSSSDLYAEPYDEFGATLTAGKFSRTRTDLVVGVPYEDIGSVAGGGMVHVFSFTTAPVTGGRQIVGRVLSQATSGVPGTPEASDLFGFSLATGDFNGDGKEELVVGVPYENIGSLVNAGGVHVFHGAAAGLSFSNSEFWTQSDIFGSSPSPFDGSPTEANDLFGHSLAAADFNGDGKQDLAIGVPYEDVITTHDGTTYINIVMRAK